MGGSVRSSSRAGLAVALALAAASGCNEELPPIEGTTSLRIDLMSPSATGAPDDRLPDTDRTLVMTIEALDAEGLTDSGFTKRVDVYAHFLGSLTPELGEEPLATAQITNGRSGTVTIDLPLAFGPTFLWVEDSEGADATFATGTTPTLWYRDPFLEDVSRPDESSDGALQESPLEEKEVSISGSRYGANGRMIVTGVYAQGYTVSDVECQDAGGSPPCTTGDYDHVFVFSFSRPAVEGGGTVQVGQTISRVNGAIQEFNGLTEVGFPQTFSDDDDPDPARVPEPTVIQESWLTTAIEMERVEAALVAVDNAKVCPLDAAFETRSQWKLDLGGGCSDTVNVISKGSVADFDPADYVGQVLPRVVGTLRPVNTANGDFNVWIIFPRDADDIALP